MTQCPTDTVLQRFLADALPAAGVRDFERHLDGCEICRRRLDGLADVTAVGSALIAAAGNAPAPTPGLDQAIARLEQEATTHFPVDLPPGTVMPALPSSGRPDSIGRLGAIEIRRMIGRGGMGVVYEGLDPALDRHVAVKVLSPHLAGDNEAKERFLREARAAAALTDDHVVTIHAIDQCDGAPYLVLQFVDGESLAGLLAREKRLPVETVARIGAQVARGLAAAHARGLVHRDIKPANILIEQGTGLARLTDFGLAKVVGGQPITGVGMLAGTPGYMSPEQAAGKEIDGRSDLFGLGVVLYAAVSGQQPFAGDSPFVVLEQIRNRKPTPLAQIDPTIPAWFGNVVDRLLEKDAARRIQTATEVAELLERRTDRPAHRPTTAYWVAGAAVAVAVLAGVAGLVAYRARPTYPEPSQVTPAAGPPPGFVIVNRSDHFPSLGDAAEAAIDGDIIEIHGDGPHGENRVAVRGKKLTIRAAAGYRPQIQPDAPGQRADAQWISSDTALTLEGLDILWPVPGPKQKWEPSNAPAVILALSGRLTVRDCRIICGRRAGCIIAAVDELNIEKCHIVAEGGVPIWWRPDPKGKMRVGGSVIEGDSSIWITLQSPGTVPKPDWPSVEMTHNTLAGRLAWVFVHRELPKFGVRLDARRNIHSVSHLFTLPTQTDASQTLRQFRGLVDWTGSENVFERNCSYVNAIQASSLKVIPTSLNSLRGWQDHWKSKDTDSIEGDIRFHPRPESEMPAPLRLDGIGKASGMVPIPVGAGDLPFKD